MCVKLFKVAFAYNRDTVLNDISLTIERGDFTAVVGPNGAGKSTILKIIAGILSPLSGIVTVGGRTVSEARAKGLISYVPQNYGKNIIGFPATVEEVVQLGIAAASSNKGCVRHGAEHIVNHMLELVGCQDLRNRRIGDLSGGQQQRVMVARALAGNPELLLLDEPTSGIDYEASSKIYELLGHLNKNLGVTVIMISHDIDKAITWANKVACINRGLCFYGNSQDFNSSHLGARHLWYYSG